MVKQYGLNPIFIASVLFHMSTMPAFSPIPAKPNLIEQAIAKTLEAEKRAFTKKVALYRNKIARFLSRISTLADQQILGEALNKLRISLENAADAINEIESRLNTTISQAFTDLFSPLKDESLDDQILKVLVFLEELSKIKMP